MPLCALARADEPDPFQALTDGRVRLSPPGGELWVEIPGHEARRVAEDGRYVLPGVPRAPVRAFGSARHPGAGLYHAGELLVSEPGASAPERGSLTLDLRGPGQGLPPLFSLEGAGPGGAAFVTLAAGERVPVSVFADTPAGESIDGLAPAAAGAVQLESSDPSVAAVSPEGLVTGRAPGLAAIRIITAGETAQVMARVDGGADRDGDGLPDAWESRFDLDPDDPADARTDHDGDGLTALEEFRRRSHPGLVDTDGDGLSDGDEVDIHGTDPAMADTDGDSVADGEEVERGLDPLDPNVRSEQSFSPALKARRSLSAASVRGAARPDDVIFVVTERGNLESFSVNPPLYFVVPQGTESLDIEPVDLEVDGAWAYVSGEQAGQGSLLVVDVREPTAMRLTAAVTGLGRIVQSAASGGRVHVLTADRLLVLESDGSGGLDMAGSVTVEGGARLAVSEPFVFVGLPDENRLQLIDASDPSRPVARGDLPLPTAAGPLSDLAASGRFVYVAHGSAGVVAVSARDPDALTIIDSSIEDPDVFAASLVARGQQLVWFAPDDPRALPVYRIEEDGRIQPSGSFPVGVFGLEQLFFNQEYLVALGRESFAVSEVLPRGDRDGVPPGGEIIPSDERRVFAPGETLSFTARATDDVHLDVVEVHVGGRTIMTDGIPPFRFDWRLDATGDVIIVPGTELPISAVGVDLQGNRGDIGTLVIRIDGDLDGDGTPDALDRDRDGDGLADLEELYPGRDGLTSDPERADTDGDTISDGEESRAGEDGFVTDPRRLDSDGDDLPDSYEILVSGTDPSRADSDGDGVADGREDPDGDGLTTALESRLGTDPLRVDTDGDALADGLEVGAGLDPLLPDSDGDAIADGDEDTDDDGIPNRLELVAGTLLDRADTDGDGLDDGTELALATDPRETTDFSGHAMVFVGRTVKLHGPLVVESLTLERSVLTVPEPRVDEYHVLELVVNGRLTVDAGSRIDVTGKGYVGGFAGGNASARGVTADFIQPEAPAASGGSHGGLGGAPGVTAAGTSATPPTYDRYLQPDRPGGGGAAGPSLDDPAVDDVAGYNGGGLARIHASTLVLAGRILADGAGPSRTGGMSSGGAGAGGGLFVSVDVLEGEGEISADGGDAVDRAAASGAGGGGGGRVAVEVADLSGFTGAVHARGGAAAVLFDGEAPLDEAVPATGGAGTVFFKSPASRHGDLIVDNGGLSSTGITTPQRAVGAGTVAGLSASTLEADLAFPVSDTGLSGQAIVLDGALETPFVIESNTATTLTTSGELDMTTVGRVGGLFRGVLLLDSLLVRGGATFGSGGDIILVRGGAFTLAADSRVEGEVIVR